MAAIDPKKATPEEIQEALEHMAKTKAQRAKQRERVKNDPEAQAKRKEYSTRNRIRKALIIAKAEAAGITVSNAEVEKEIKKRGLEA